jgi:hypothetical protein
MAVMVMVVWIMVMWVMVMAIRPVRVVAVVVRKHYRVILDNLK